MPKTRDDYREGVATEFIAGIETPGFVHGISDNS